MENGDVSRGMAGSGESSVEFRLLMAYAQRRRPRSAQQPQPQPGGEPPRSPNRKRKRSSKLRKLLLMCVGPQGDREEEPKGETVDVTSLADRLSSIVDSVDMNVDDIEADGQDDVIQQIVDLLRESGDQFTEKIKEDKVLARHFGGGDFTYAAFARIASRFLQEVAPSSSSSPSGAVSRIALACEVTRKLTAVDGHPMNMVMGFGAKYLRENFSTWVQQHGGWENAFADVEEDEVE
ncbi:apoptosis facilitator Bcl-2-like protein 14 [Anguilla rostrata]|uniref:apoptosis facilitator Bcl-2-like protein 14 n=1 Tax=Anguilla rostrata TaxID=7938 RepID=UPI0030D24AC2